VPKPPLTIAVAQPACIAYDIDANALLHAEAVRAARTRVVVFPELSLTGYELDAPTVAADDLRLAPIIDACAETGAIALVGAPVDGPHIAILAVDGLGATIAYRKVYVDPSESAHFIAGPAPAVIEVDCWRLGLGICRDTGIVAHAADTAALGIDVYVAGTLMHARETGEQDSRGHRIATGHGVWVAFASWANPTGAGYDQPAGRSTIWSPDGAIMARATTATGEIATATLTR
jgi:predicted amidohydrolase